MENIISNYYSELFSSENPTHEDICKITSLISPVISFEVNNILESLFTREEVRKALFDLNPSKAPSLDGFNELFYQDFWEILQDDITKETLKVLNQEESLTNWNPTVITLIPKKKDPMDITDYHPISLCDVSYKIIARAITNRFRATLGDCVNPHQSAFIPGRCITDNVLLGF